MYSCSKSNGRMYSSIISLQWYFFPNTLYQYTCHCSFCECKYILFALRRSGYSTFPVIASVCCPLVTEYRQCMQVFVLSATHLCVMLTFSFQMISCLYRQRNISCYLKTSLTSGGTFQKHCLLCVTSRNHSSLAPLTYLKSLPAAYHIILGIKIKAL